MFKQSIKGFQSNVFTGTGFALANAGKQSTFGIEFDGSVRPVDGLNLTLAATYLDAKYDSFVNSAFGDISGTTPAGIPALSMSMGATYTHEFAGGTKAIAHVDYSYESPVQIVEGLSGFPAGVRRRPAARGELAQRIVHDPPDQRARRRRVGSQPDQRAVPHDDLPGRRAGGQRVGLSQPAAHLWRYRSLQILIG